MAGLLRQAQYNMALSSGNSSIFPTKFYKYESTLQTSVSRFLNFEICALVKKSQNIAKMCLKGLQVVVILMIVSLSLCDDGDMYPRGPIVPPPRRPPPDLVNNNLGNGFLNSGLLAASGLMNSGLMNSGFMNTARNFVTSPTGQMAVSMAKEFISRSAGGNQVLSLNLTSLLTLVLLKALIFATGLFSAGNYGQYGRGRGLEGSELG